MERYDVTMDKKVIGSVTVTQEGLYSRLQCRCMLPDPGIHKLVACCVDRRVELGILVPEGQCFGLETRIPRKKIGEGNPHFSVFALCEDDQNTFVDINPDIPFANLQMVTKARAEVRDGKLGILIPIQPLNKKTQE